MSDLPREWHGGSLPPGTPAPSSYSGALRCSECGDISSVSFHSELGSRWVEPEECPKCSHFWDDKDEELEDDGGEADNAYDNYRIEQMDRAEDDRY